MQKEEIKPITMPGIHERVYGYLRMFIDPSMDLYILDAGAGHGAFTRRLFEDGFKVAACDLDPANFHFDRVTCTQADITRKLPYGDQSFDLVLLIEVMEHIHDHRTLFMECHRVLRPGGILFFSTPNILSLKSRLRFLCTGFFYAFKPLDHSREDGRQHVSSLTADQFNYLASVAGFSDSIIDTDKYQSSSRWLTFLVPWIWLWTKLKRLPYRLHNHRKLLLGRLLFFKVTK